ncbi:serine/threonine-protein kinase-like protein At5g23170 [Momordica charantia]|uniref:Serine/threonine-protein kinase-like protein At5g23170 n=1 Tax=Momordica charantia TaxID=3673 RepID=A0A6J1DC59_MOMCH|nr:serine/threonine-protein kinase-like protein At5g23170 [Momordica charantia]
MELFEYQQLLYATDGFSPARLIGKGSHGWVYKAILEDDTVVAVKKPLESNSKKLENEARVLCGLGHNPLVVNFLGTSVEKKRRLQLLVMEFMPNGSLHDLVAAPNSVTWPKRLQIITQIARAVQFLHEDLVIHRDIKPQNILFDSHWNPKLADFGLAVTGSGSGQPAGTIGYLDPCYCTPGRVSTKSDVFSFGVVLLEVMSGRKAMDVSRSPASIVEWARPLIEEQNYGRIYDRRVAVPKYLEGATRKVLDMAGRCVCGEQGRRPSMGEIVEAMEMSSALCCIERVKLFPAWSSLVVVKLMRRRRRKQGKKRPFNVN